MNCVRTAIWWRTDSNMIKSIWRDVIAPRVTARIAPRVLEMIRPDIMSTVRSEIC